MMETGASYKQTFVSRDNPAKNILDIEKSLTRLGNFDISLRVIC